MYKLPVIFLAIRPLDPKHLIPGNGSPKIQGWHKLLVAFFSQHYKQD